MNFGNSTPTDFYQKQDCFKTVKRKARMSLLVEENIRLQNNCHDAPSPQRKIGRKHTSFSKLSEFDIFAYEIITIIFLYWCESWSLVLREEHGDDENALTYKK
jgi:hypothetical protein